MNNEYATNRFMTKTALIDELNKIVCNYMKIYDEYYSKGSRDSLFLKDLVDGIQGISAVLEVYAEDKKINPNYAVEKLNLTKKYVDTTIEYFKSKNEYIKKKGNK